MNNPSPITLRIENLAFEGPGVGHFQEKAVFVPFALPGDLLEVEIIKDKGSFAEGKIIKIIEPSAHKTDPPCPYFFRCGGCQWMHLTYEEQLGWKQKLFLETLQKIGGISLAGPVPIVSSAPFGYRKRIRLKALKKKEGLLLGYHRAGSHEIIDIEACIIADSLINAALSEVRDLLTRCLPEREIFDVEIVRGENDNLLCSIICNNKDHLFLLRNYLPKTTGREKMISGITVQDDRGNEYPVVGKEAVPYSYRYATRRVIKYKFSPAAFSQVSNIQNSKLIDLVLGCLAGESYREVADFYCGIGNITLPLSLKAEKVTGIETSAVAVKWAILNARENKMKNYSFWQMDALEGFSFLLKKGGQPDLVVLDPPRTGAKEVVCEIVRQQGAFVRKIIYISCHPATFARDLKILTSGGFQLERVTLIDMFPQSYHLEIVASLVSTK